jgi:hypothetical protein
MKVLVKHWVGNSNEDAKATFTEYKSKAKAFEYIKTQRLYHSRNNTEIMNCSNFYEIINLK